VQQRREQNAGQPGELAWMDAETLQPQIEPPVQQLDQPEQDDEAQRDPGRQPEAGAGALGAGVVRVGDMNLH